MSDLVLADEELRTVTHLKQPAAQARFLDRMRVPYRRRADGTLLVGRSAMERAMLADLPSTSRAPSHADTSGMKWSIPA